MNAEHQPESIQSSESVVIAKTRRWLEEIVVGLNLCPFARPVMQADTLRYSVCETEEWDLQRRFFLEELSLLAEVEPTTISTSLLLFPKGLELFPVYLDFLGMAELLLEQAGLSGVFQVASFHPEYLFGGVEPSDRSHFTNRSPFPTLHLIREDDISRAVDGPIDTEGIPDRNIERLQRLSAEEWLALFGGPPPKTGQCSCPHG